MPDLHRIEALPRLGGRTVVVRGWVMTTRSSGKIAFVTLRDGTGYLQVVLSKKDVPEAAWEAFGRLTQEASVEVTGMVRADTRAPGGVELTAADLKILGPSVDFPITPKEHGTAFLFEHRHLWLRSRRQVAIARVRHEVIQAIRDFFYERNFVLVDTPILTGAIGEAAGHLFSTEYFDLGTAYLAQTGQLYVEAAAAAHGKVYCFGPTFRAEKSKTRRHLTEFWMVEPEVAWNDSDDNMKLQEEFVCYLVARALERKRAELADLERDTTPLERVRPRPGRGRRDSARQAVRPSRAGLQLSQGRKGLLYEGKPRRRQHRAQQRHAGAGGLRRDHRRQPARGRLRQAARAHPRGQVARGGVQLVPGSPEVWDVRALGFRARRRAHRRVDLRGGRLVGVGGRAHHGRRATGDAVLLPPHLDRPGVWSADRRRGTRVRLPAASRGAARAGRLRAATGRGRLGRQPADAVLVLHHAGVSERVRAGRAARLRACRDAGLARSEPGGAVAHVHPLPGAARRGAPDRRAGDRVRPAGGAGAHVRGNLATVPQRRSRGRGGRAAQRAGGGDALRSCARPSGRADRAAGRGGGAALEPRSPALRQAVDRRGAGRRGAGRRHRRARRAADLLRDPARHAVDESGRSGRRRRDADRRPDREPAL